MARRGTLQRTTRWLWTSPRVDASVARLLLRPAAWVWRVAESGRRAARRRVQGPPPPVPVIGVDNLTVGGSGRSVVLRWLAQQCLDAGRLPGVLLAPESRREAGLLRRAVPGALVAVAGARDVAALQAVADGAAVLLADETRQRADLPAGRLLLVLAAETARAVPWTVPAGPWRESLAAVRDATAVVITRRRADGAAVEALEARVRAFGFRGPVGVVDLGLAEVEGLVSGRRQPAASLAGRRVVACTGSEDPHGFAAMLKGVGAAVQVSGWASPDGPQDEDVAWLARAVRKADCVVVPEHVGALLRDRWPASVPEPLVTVAAPRWERGEAAVRAALLATDGPAGADDRRPDPRPKD